MGQQEQTAEVLRDQPIWVQDLLAWLEKIQRQNLTGDEWVRQVQDVFAELPGQGLPKEFWPKRQADDGVEASQAKEEAEPQPLSDEDRVRIWEELNEANSIADEKRRSEDLAAIATQIPASELQLLQAALDAANRIEDEGCRRLVLAAVVAQIPASEPQLLQAAFDVANSIENDLLRQIALFAVAAQIPMSEPQLLQVVLEVANSIRFKFVFNLNFNADIGIG